MIMVRGTSLDGADDGTNLVQNGDFESVYVSGSRNALSANVTKIGWNLADDGNTAIASGSAVRTVENRLLLAATQTGNISAFGVENHTKVASDISGVTGHVAGSWNYLECTATAKTSALTSASLSMIDLPTGAVIPASTVISAIAAGSNTLSGTHTGKAAVIKAEAPVAGAFDFFLSVAASTGYSTQSGGTPTIVGKLAVCDAAGTALGYITINSIA